MYMVLTSFALPLQIAAQGGSQQVVNRTALAIGANQAAATNTNANTQQQNNQTVAPSQLNQEEYYTPTNQPIYISNANLLRLQECCTKERFEGYTSLAAGAFCIFLVTQLYDHPHISFVLSLFGAGLITVGCAIHTIETLKALRE
jgi:hypothetical protein